MTDPVALETLKLLVQVAWADRDVEPEEVDVIIDLARQAGVDDRDVEELRRGLSDSGRLQAPDLALLRQHRRMVLDLVDVTIGADHRIAEGEPEARDAIIRLLEHA